MKRGFFATVRLSSYTAAHHGFIYYVTQVQFEFGAIAPAQAGV
jgi:hypothetical protein